MKIAILGTRGIPNHYGGFEQITEYLSDGLAEKGHEVTVYNVHHHPYRAARWKQVRIIHCYDPGFLKTAGQFIYDLNCICDARQRDFDVILFMGYTSSSVWHRLFPKQSTIISNMDGLEWKRAKYAQPVKWFLRYAEKMAVRHSHLHIADAVGIRQYLEDAYGIHCAYIAYGASLDRREQPSALKDYGLSAQAYFLLMARMEPENHVDMILQGFHRSASSKKFMVIGNTGNHYGRSLVKKYARDDRILFAGAVFDQDLLHTLRKNCLLYFHGHSVGGTNPSLLEAMASKALIAAHDNVFNRAILGGDAFYFSSADAVEKLVAQSRAPALDETFKARNLRKIRTEYNWQHIVDQYDDLITRRHQQEKHEKNIHHRGYAFK